MDRHGNVRFWSFCDLAQCPLFRRCWGLSGHQSASRLMITRPNYHLSYNLRRILIALGAVIAEMAFPGRGEESVLANVQLAFQILDFSFVCVSEDVDRATHIAGVTHFQFLSNPTVSDHGFPSDQPRQSLLARIAVAQQSR